MSAPPPYQNQPPYQGQPPYPGQPQQPYGYAQPQQPYGYAQPPQPQPQPPSRPQPPRRSPVHSLLSVAVVVAVFGGAAWYVWDYNTDPNGGKAKKEAARTARVEEGKTHDPQVGDCVKVQDPEGEPLPTIVDCGSPEAQYKTADKLYGAGKKCGPSSDYGIQVTSRRSLGYTLCFTKV
ncbi:hypothetical protein AB0K09_13100 [Streptomyces sp. NPDC049577]|uniref:LppU/SCO3897 family protein n=1 Tax=Streptomyces sp. NPDC049577 TaxID=3155153 RepID=UPI003446BA86